MIQKDQEIRIPMEYIERIDDILATENPLYRSREQFIKSAIEMKLDELDSCGRNSDAKQNRPNG